MPPGVSPSARRRCISLQQKKFMPKTPDCLEALGNIVAIFPVPSGTYNFAVPFNVRATTISLSDITSLSESAFIDDLYRRGGLMISSVQYLADPSRTITIEERPSIKASTKKARPGLYFNVKISARSFDMQKTVESFVRYIQDAPYFDTFILDTEDNLYLVRGVEPATDISTDIVLPRTQEQQIDIEVNCVNGLQQVV